LLYRLSYVGVSPSKKSLLTVGAEKIFNIFVNLCQALFSVFWNREGEVEGINILILRRGIFIN